MPPAGASNRRQSTRPARTTASRPANYYARPFAGRGSILGTADNASTSQTAPGFFPAITHFTDAITALPKEIIKHVSLLKEVEAKLHAPQQEAQALVETIKELPTPPRREVDASLAILQGMSAPGSTTASVAGSVGRGHGHAFRPPPLEHAAQSEEERATAEQVDLHRRQLFKNLCMTLHQIVQPQGSLDEKVSVLSSTNMALDTQLQRMTSSYNHLDNEISEEARYGSLTHWAYHDKTDLEKKKVTSNERTRRDVASANNLAAAAAAVHEGDIAATRSEARREAMQAKRSARAAHIDSDFEDTRPALKRPPANRGRKVLEPGSAADGKVQGLGITNGPKRRKVEKTAALGGTGMERSMSTAMKIAAGASGGRGGGSPRATPGLEGPKKAAKAPPVPAQARKRSAAAGANSPLLASSPLAPSFPTTKEQPSRPGSSRARQNSYTTPLVQDIARNRAPSVASNRPTNGTNLASVDPIRSNTPAAMGTTKDTEISAPPAIDTATNGTFKREDTDMADAPGQDVESAPPVVTRAGRTSKTATPITGSFPEVPMQRSRSTRNHRENNNSAAASQASSESNTNGHSKRSHKKGTSSSALQNNAFATNPQKRDPSEAVSSDREQDFSETGGIGNEDALAADGVGDETGVDDDPDADEPTYCYCDGVSYGDMVACDNRKCPKEWFHLECCPDLEKAPAAKTKWYCDLCKPKFNVPIKKGRPGSSRQ